MKFDVPLDDILRSRSHIRILRVLISVAPELNLSGRDVARRSGVSHPRASRVLTELGEQGIVTERRHAGYALYELNKAHVLAGAVRRLFDAEQEVAEDLLTVLGRGVSRSSRHVRSAVLVDDPDDDLELVLLTAPGQEMDVDLGLEPVIEEVRRRNGNRVERLVVARRRAVELVRSGDPAWRRIARDGIPVFRTFPRVR